MSDPEDELTIVMDDGREIRANLLTSFDGLTHLAEVDGKLDILTLHVPSVEKQQSP